MKENLRQPISYLSFKKLRNILLVAAATLVMGSKAQADQLISDVLVVQDGMSIGRDSQTNWGYGFDTLVFRENNLRIFFDDTSANDNVYPYNDWRIAINDTTTNGASYFSIDDATAGKTPFKIMAGAPNNALYINGDSVGIGTSDPKLDFHIKSGDTPALRLEQVSPQYGNWTWDIGGNEANFYIRDLTGGSRLPFRIRPGAPSSTLDLRADGSVGIGLADQNAFPKARVHMNVNTNLNQGVLIGALTVESNSATLHVEGSGYVATKLGIGANSSGQSSTLHVNGTAFISQTLEIGSSRTRKENIRDVTLEEAQATLKELQPVQFNYKGDTEHQLGFIAEDVPDTVATQSRKSLVPMDFVAVLTKVVQDHERREIELQAKVQAQDELLKKLTAKLATMEERLEQNDRTAGR